MLFENSNASVKSSRKPSRKEWQGRGKGSRIDVFQRFIYIYIYILGQVEKMRICSGRNKGQEIRISDIRFIRLTAYFLERGTNYHV